MQLKTKISITKTLVYALSVSAILPPPPPLVLNKAPGTDETSVFGIAAIESAARKKTLHVNFAARFGFKPDGGKPGTPWWVVDGYDREPSIYDP